MAPQRDTTTRRGKNSTGRPRRTDTCSDVSAATRYRAQVLREITNNLARIHDLLLTEYQIRDINDTINRLLKERRSWEYRIKQLGGADFTNVNNTSTKDSLTIKGYKYFGRARELPDVVKLLQEATLEKESKIGQVNSEKSLKAFQRMENWPRKQYYFREKEATQLLDDIKAGKLPKPVGLDSTSTPIDYTSRKPITQDTEFMEKYLLQQKKKFLLRRIRSKSKT